MEVLMEDDFGDLYADFEVQAISAISSVSNFTKLYAEPVPREGEHDNKNTKEVDSSTKEESIESDSRQNNSLGEKFGNFVADGSDSEDDLNIVLNDEECERFPITTAKTGNEGGCEKHKDGNDNGFIGVKNGSDMNGLDPSANGQACERGNGVKGRYRFQYSHYKHGRPNVSSLTSNRKVDDSADVAYYSPKPSGDDLEDNKSKQQRVSNSGQVPSIHATGNSVVSHGGYGFSLPWYRTILDVNIDVFEDKRWRHPGVDISDFFNFGFNENSWKQYCISLEQLRQQSYLHSRIPFHESSKLSQPKGRAIQVEDSLVERQPTMNLKRPRSWDSDVVIRITVQDSKENSAGPGEEELGDINSTAHKSSKNSDLDVDDIKETHYSGSGTGDELSAESIEGNMRHSQPLTESNQMSLDPDSCENKISDATGYNHQKLNVQTSDGIAEATKSVGKMGEEIGGDICKSDQCLIQGDLSLGVRSHFSTTLSCYRSDYELSGDSVYNVLNEAPNPLRGPSSDTELQESVTSDHKRHRSKPGDGQSCSRKKSPLWEDQKHRNDRLHRVPKRSIHPDVSSMLWDRSSVDCRRTERLCDFDYHNGEDFSYHRGRDLSCGHRGKRYADSHVQAVYTKHPHRKYPHSFRDEMKPQDRRNWNEEEYFHERTFKLDNQNDMDRDWHIRGRRLSPQNMIPVAYREPRQLVSKYNNIKERGIHWRRKNDIRFGKRSNHDNCSFRCNNGDNLMQEKRGRYASFSNWKWDSLDENCGRHSPFVERELTLRRVRYGDNPPRYMDCSWQMEIEDKHLHFSSQSHKASYATSEERWQDMMSPRGDMFNSRLTEKYGRQSGQTFDEESRDSGWAVNYNDTDDREHVYPGDDVCLGRRKYGWQSRVLHWAHDVSFLRCQDERFYWSSRKTSRNEYIRAKNRSTGCGMAVDDMHVEQHTEKMSREESSGYCANRNPTMTYRVEPEEKARRGSDMVDDLFIGEGKSSGRCSSQTSKSIQANIPKTEGSHGDKKWHDKFPVTEHNGDSDIEEGQVITEELNMERNLEKKCLSRSAAAKHNVKKRIFHPENASSRDESKRLYDNQRILETIAKMEKRRERFKDTMALNKESDSTPKLQADLMADTVDTMQERPARKRRWGGN